MTSVSAAVATVDGSPAGLVRQYQDDFAMVLPSHVKPDTFTRLVLGALRRDPKLNEAAGNNPAAFLGAVLDAARLGHEPGTEAYYLVPRKRKGRLEVQGIEGYQGIVERIYRAGAVSSVVVEVVRERDEFTYVVGRDDRPVHEVDWFGDDRGSLVGAYAYAVMKDGATSKVVVLNKTHIAALRAKSDGANSEYSPWQTNEEAMW
jgi:recombination protein RecT